MGALRQLGITEAETARTITRLGTGLRINTASDDPAGLIVSEGLRAQLKGIEQAIRNSQDAISMSKTAEAALDEVQRLLRNIRGLAVQSANSAVVDSPQLEANQAQIRATLQSIERIATQTQWGTKRLLDGTAGVISSVLDTANIQTIFIGSSFNGRSVGAGPITIDRTQSATRETIALDVTFTNPGVNTPGPGNFVINGYTFSADGVSETVNDLIAKINAQSQNTGVVASLTGSGPFTVSLQSTEYGADFDVTFVDPNNLLSTTDQPAPTTAGQDAVALISVTDSEGTVQTATFTGGQGARTSGLRLSDNEGNVITLTPDGNVAGGLTNPTLVGVTTVGSMRFQIGAYANQNVSFSLPSIMPDQLGDFSGENLTDIDVTASGGGERAIQIIDSAITQLSQLRGNVGSFQANFLESTVRSLGVAQENVSASESQIRDVDMAQALSEYVRLQVLQQSGLSVLAQANQRPQSVLQLLQQ